jgi:tRNA(fMet)-specific endonuclease VapC
VRLLLDTNIVSEMIRHPHGRVYSQIVAVGADQVSTSVIVAAELRFGAAKKQSPALTERVEGALARLDVLDFAPPADRHYADLRAHLERVGQMIGANDLLIAAHALALGYGLVTDNEREFARVPELRIENWLR